MTDRQGIEQCDDETDAQFHPFPYSSGKSWFFLHADVALVDKKKSGRPPVAVSYTLLDLLSLPTTLRMSRDGMNSHSEKPMDYPRFKRLTPP